MNIIFFQVCTPEKRSQVELIMKILFVKFAFEKDPKIKSTSKCDHYK